VSKSKSNQSRTVGRIRQS